MTPQEKLIAATLCPGCMYGMNPENCDSYQYREQAWDGNIPFFGCENHWPGTSINCQISICLGLPKGFNRMGDGWYALCQKDSNVVRHWFVRLWLTVN